MSTSDIFIPGGHVLHQTASVRHTAEGTTRVPQAQAQLRLKTGAQVSPHGYFCSFRLLQFVIFQVRAVGSPLHV